MRIGIYNPRVGTAESGGTETFLREMMKRLVKDHTVTLLTGEGSLHPAVEALDIETVQVPFTRKESRTADILTSYTPIIPAEVESVSMFLNAKRSGLLDQFDNSVDVVSTHYYLDNILVSRWLETPSVFHFPGIKHPSIRWKAMAYLADPDLYLANSKSTQQRINRWLDISVDGIVYAGVDVERFSPDSELAFEDDRTSILYVGRLDEGKGLRALIDATEQLTDARVHIVGGGTLEEELKERAADNGVSERIVFHGSVSHDEIHRYYAAADIFCLPSEHESLGIVNLEAMATALPVVSTRIDAIEEYITDGENGLLVQPGNLTELVAALDMLLNSVELREEFGGKGRTTAQSFSWEEQAGYLVDYYEQAIN